MILSSIISMFNQYSVFLIAAAPIIALLAGYTWWYRRQALDRATGMALLLMAITLYVGGYGMELASSDLAGMLLWSRVEYLGIALLPMLILVVILGYTDRARHLSPSILAVLSIIPAITIILTLTQNPLYYQTVGIDISAPFPRLAFTPGPWYVVNMFYLFTAQAIGVVLLGLKYLHSTRDLYRSQTLIMGLGTIAPFIAFLMYLSGFSPIPHLDLVPFALIATAGAFVVGVVSFQLYDLTPIAHSTVFRQIPVGVMIVDDRGRVTEVNPAAEAVLGLVPGGGIGRDLATISARFPELGKILVDAEPGTEEEVRHGDETFTFEVVRLRDQWDRSSGSVLLIRDISLRLQTEESLSERTRELEVANRQLALISAITRHDIGNQLVVMNGCLDLLFEDEITATQARAVDQLQGATDRVGTMVGFMRDYQAIGTSAPRWTDLRDLTERAAAGVALGEVQIINQLPAIEVLADPLIEKVISTLFENAVRHGEKVTTISISAEIDGDGRLVIACKDDGIGVPPDRKERIFERGYGTNTGLGLFLAREILVTTGMTIAETGLFGAGCRFEVCVPPGRFQEVRGPGPLKWAGDPAGIEGSDDPIGDPV